MRCSRLVALPILAFAAVSCGSADNETTTRPAASLEPTTEVAIVATEYSFSGDPATSIVAGDIVRFTVSNKGTLDHEMRVLDSTGQLLDQTGTIAPGGTREVVVAFEEAGNYQVVCDIDDHLTRGQRSVFEVTDD